jgi:hypothetical protein
MCELPIEKEEAIMEMSISVEGAGGGLDWPRWKRLVPDLEQLGFAGIFLSDHFGFSEEKELDSLELMIALTYLADHTERVRFGSLVAPLSFRDPVFLARQAAAVDDLSGGRMTLAPAGMLPNTRCLVMTSEIWRRAWTASRKASQS